MNGKRGSSLWVLVTGGAGLGVATEMEKLSPVLLSCTEFTQFYCKTIFLQVTSFKLESKFGITQASG